MDNLDTIIGIKSAGLGWVPLTEAVRNLPTREGKIYIFTDGVIFFASSDGKAPKLAWFTPTHVALVDKPESLPKEAEPDYLLTKRTVGLAAKAKECPECAVREFPPCHRGVPCCMCHQQDCNLRQPCERKKKNGK